MNKEELLEAIDSRRFKEVYPNIDIHKNNPTVLYIPESIK